MDYKKLSIGLAALLVVSLLAGTYAYVAPPVAPPVTVTKTATVTSTATVSADPLAERIEAAKKEGKLVIYTYTNQYPTVAEKFTKKYGLQLEAVTGSSFEVRQKSLQEAQAGVFKGDIYEGSSQLADHYSIKNLAVYYSPLLSKVPSDAIYQSYPDATWYNIFGDVRSIAYRTDRISAQDVAKLDWQSVTTDPRWKGGKIGLSDPGLGGVGTGMYQRWQQMLGDNKIKEWTKALILQEPRTYRDEPVSQNALGTGEIWMWLDGTLSKVKQLQDQGAPVDWVKTIPRVGTVTAIGIAAKAPHPNVARLFIDWTHTPEGAQALVDIGRPATMLTLPGVNAPDFMKQWLTGQPIYWGPPGNDINRKPYADQWNSIMKEVTGK